VSGYVVDDEYCFGGCVKVEYVGYVVLGFRGVFVEL